jgi:hypothetical protein
MPARYTTESTTVLGVWVVLCLIAVGVARYPQASKAPGKAYCGI